MVHFPELKLQLPNADDGSFFWQCMSTQQSPWSPLFPTHSVPNAWQASTTRNNRKEIICMKMNWPSIDQRSVAWLTKTYRSGKQPWIERQWRRIPTLASFWFGVFSRINIFKQNLRMFLVNSLMWSTDMIRNQLSQPYLCSAFRDKNAC